MAKIVCLALEGCLFSGTIGLMDAFGVADLLHRADRDADAAPLFDTEIVTIGGRPVTAWGNVVITAHKAIADATKADVVLVPPVLPHIGPAQDGIGNLLAWLIDHHRRGHLVGAMCTGTFTLADTGLLDGRRATTNWQYARMFQRRYPRVRLEPEKVMTEDSGLICTGAATSFFHLALYLIERFGSAALARTCGRALLVDPNRNSQIPYAAFDGPTDHGDAGILKAQQIMEKDFHEPLVIDAIARQVGISPRHFKRRFKQATGRTPLSYLQQVRIGAAKARLERSTEPVSAITVQVGYADTSSFCRLFKKTTGLSPRDYRQRFFDQRSA